MRRNAWVVFLTLAAVCIILGGAAQKSYSFDRVDITARLQNDGSMNVLESRTYDFDGEFSYATLEIPLEPDLGDKSPIRRPAVSIEDFQVSESNTAYQQAYSRQPGTYSTSVEGGVFKASWYYRAQNEQRTFNLAYRVSPAVLVYSDAAELYWKFIGPGWDVSSREVRIKVIPPLGAEADRIRAWAHGPLWGSVSLSKDGAVLFEVNDLPARRMVEARVMLPVSAFSSAPRTPGTIQPTILSEERAWAESANRTRRFQKLSLIAALAGIAAAFVIAFWLWGRYDHEFRPAFEGDYFRELPADYSPAVLGVLWHFGSPGVNDMVATLIDLSRRSLFRIEEVRTEHKVLLGVLGTATDTDYRLVATEKAQTATKPHESYLSRFLLDRYGDGQSVSFDQIKAGAKKRPTEFQNMFAHWQSLVKEEARSYGFFDTTTGRGRLIGALAGLAYVLAGGVLIWQEALPAGIVLILTGAALATFALCMRRRSHEGATQYARWKALKRFLRDFSSMEDAPLPSLAIWEHYLVYAITLGVAAQVIALLPRMIEKYGETYPGWYAGHNLAAFTAGEGLSNFTHSFESMASSFHDCIATAHSAASSSSGSGGGFSSGGGGGGGGGGGSAG